MLQLSQLFHVIDYQGCWIHLPQFGKFRATEKNPTPIITRELRELLQANVGRVSTVCGPCPTVWPSSSLVAHEAALTGLQLQC